MKGDKREVFSQLRREYGDLVCLKVGVRNIILVSGLDMLHKIFVTHGKDFDKRPQVFSVTKVGQAKAVVSASGEVWREHRHFLLNNMKELGIGKTKFESNVIEELNPFLQHLRDSNGQDFDSQYCIQTAVCNIICSISFGQRFDYEDAEFKEILHIFDENMKVNGSTALVNYFPFLEDLPGDPFKCNQSLDNVAKVQKILSSWIAKHSETLDPKNPRDIIDYYILEMRSKTENGSATTMDDSQLLKFVGDLFVGGTETTSTSLRWALIYFVRYPHVQDKIFKEISQTLAGRDQLSVLDRKTMPYTQAAILEAQRLGDIAPFSVAHSNFDTVSVDGYTIPAHSVVLPIIHSVHADPAVWENPEEFIPERFLDEEGKVVQKKEFMPFSLGPRLCPGKTLAKMELFHFLTSIIQNFQILPESSGELPSTDGQVGITRVPAENRLRFIPRTSLNVVDAS